MKEGDDAKQQVEQLKELSVPTDGSIFCFEVGVFGAILVIAGNDPNAPLAVQFDVQDLDNLRDMLDAHDHHVFGSAS